MNIICVSLMSLTAYIIPVIFLSVLAISFLMRRPAYSSFVEGASGAIDLIKSVFPYLLAVMVAVELLRTSGIGGHIAEFTSPFFGFFGLPKELCELIIIRPLSSAGALAVLDNIYKIYGTDTYIGNCASVIYGSSETVFYLASIYFSKCNVKKLGYAIPLALVATFIGYTVGCALLSVF